MILADTSIWIDHLHASDAGMFALLQSRSIVMHPHVIGEIALGNLRSRRNLLDTLSDLPRVMVADEEEVVDLIGRLPLFGMGVGYVDSHLIASALLMPGLRLWSRDRRMNAVAMRLGICHEPLN